MEVNEVNEELLSPGWRFLVVLSLLVFMLSIGYSGLLLISKSEKNILDFFLLGLIIGTVCGIPIGLSHTYGAFLPKAKEKWFHIALVFSLVVTGLIWWDENFKFAIAFGPGCLITSAICIKIFGGPLRKSLVRED